MVVKIVARILAVDTFTFPKETQEQYDIIILTLPL